ncbi:coiled-coil domain-containing protein 15 [Thunnus maccoyii]|uniref:coiled-coil domain-containing protein 15 n=1 Tax=Thunnus maccoyii TaxID=8240 RepID=UPI001C4D1C56|nr:coiled-coil domain-containing protein 15 [Thunnus maccoyii]XP_042288246.1 coiled-coil domain-containing protein 15 [Thunnus maccoyii]
MSASRVIASTKGRRKAALTRTKEHRPSGSNKVLAERNQAVVAVGAWVEGGQDFEDPSELALLTDEIQTEKRRENEESLRRFQDEVRHRVAQVSKKRQQLQKTDSVVKPDRRIPQQHHVWTQHVSAGKKLTFASPQKEKRISRVMERSPQESSEGMRQVRLRLAACRMIPHGEMTSDLPGGEWNISPSKHKAESHVPRAEQEVEEEEEEEGEDLLFTSQHECPLVQQNISSSTFHHGLVSGRDLWDTHRSQPDPGSKSNLREPQVLWPLADQEELKRQRQSQFLMHRRLFMNIEREQVKENKQHRKHLKRTARIKAEKEQIRLEEERKLERARQLAEAQQKLEERELLILERLKLEEEERVVELERRKREEKGKVAARFIEALRAQMKERLSQEKLELPPLCCCASSFWDSHPDTCANNCVFHNNPKAYAQALHSAMLSLDC